MLTLNINTSDNEIIELSLERRGVIIKKKKIKAHRSQAEKLLPAIEKMMLGAKIELKLIKKIKVENRGSSFTSLRIGVLTANALAYALGIPVETFVSDKENIKRINNFNIVIPKYDRDPDIKIKKMKIFKNKILLTLFLLSLFFIPFVSRAETSALANRLSGKIILQVEKNGEAYYVNPLDLKGYYLGRPNDAFNIMRHFGLGVSNSDVNNFIKNGARANLSGRILLQVEDKGQAYYVNPENNRLYYLGRPADAFNIMRNLGLGISNTNLGQISLQALVINNGEAPSIEPGQKTVRFNFRYKNKDYYLDQIFRDDLYNSYKKSNKSLQYSSSNPPSNPRESYYEIFLTLKNGDDSIDNLVAGLKKIAASEGFNDNELVEFAMALVQFIPYDNTKTSASPQNFPYETLYKNSGVCSDKAFLAHSLLNGLGYGATIFDYPNDNHSAVAVACSGQSSYNSGFCFIETTNYFPVGVFPTGLSSGQARVGDVNWSEIFSGSSLGVVEIYNKTVGRLFTGMSSITSQVSAISDMNASIKNKKLELDSIVAQLSVLRAELDALLVKIDEYQATGDTSNYNISVNEYNTKVSNYNNVLNNYQLKAESYNNDISLFNKMVKDFYQN